MDISQKSAENKDSSSSVENGQNLKVVHFSQLSEGAHEVLVEHGGQVYRLRLTRNGKLILNK